MTTTEWVLLILLAAATILGGLGWVAFYGCQDQRDETKADLDAALDGLHHFLALYQTKARSCQRLLELYQTKAREHAALSGVVDAATVRAAHKELAATPEFFAAKVLSEDERAWDREVFGA